MEILLSYLNFMIEKKGFGQKFVRIMCRLNNTPFLIPLIIGSIPPSALLFMVVTPLTALLGSAFTGACIFLSLKLHDS